MAKSEPKSEAKKSEAKSLRLKVVAMTPLRNSRAVVAHGWHSGSGNVAARRG